jgi:putative ABC transport system permease protein
MTKLAEDVAHAARRLVRQPAITAVIVTTLAIGIGANAAIFGVVRQVLFAPLDLPSPDRVVRLFSSQRARGWTHGDVSRQDAADWSTASRTLSDIGTYTLIEGNAVVGTASERVRVALATAGVFRVLGVAPLLGRSLLPEDDAALGSSVAVVSHRFWASALAANPAAVGRVLTFDGKPMTIIGVMPPTFEFPDPTTVMWKPFGAPPDATGPRDARWVSAIARLDARSTVAGAGRELEALADQLARVYPATNRDVGAHIEPLLRAETGDVRTSLLVVWGMVGLILVIISTNVANLLLARASAREHELVVRAALGASGAVLARQTLVESVLLGVAGGALGITLAALAMAAMRRTDMLGLPRASAATVDAWLVTYSVGLSLFIGIAFGMAPALAAARAQSDSALRRAGRGVISRMRERTRAGLICVQVALATVVLVAASLLFRSFDRLSRVEPGFALSERVTFRIAPDWGTYPRREQAQEFYDRFLTRLAATPGVRAVAAVNRLPLTGSWWTTDYAVEGQRRTGGAARPTAVYRVITSGYFATMGLTLLRGRDVAPNDRAETRKVVIVSRRLAERAWPRADPIGRRISFAPNEPTAPWYTVVGVVSDVHSAGLHEDASPAAYVSLPQATFGHFSDWGMDVVIHTGLDANAAISAARRALASVSSTFPLFDPRPVADLVARDLARRRALMILLGAFAITAAALAGLGLYGVVSFTVTQRRPELGVRMALGADGNRMLRAVVGQSVRIAMLGVVIGLPFAAVTVRLMAGLLFDVSPLDPSAFALAATALVLLAAVAAWVPAVRASRVSPMEALRNE